MTELRFLRRLLLTARRRLRSEADYLEFQKVQAERVYADLESRFPVDPGWFVLDLGCGRGGYTEFLASRFINTLGVDYFVSPAQGALATYRSCDLLELHLGHQADMVFCASVIEHIPNPSALLQVINQNLRTGGYLYLSFPPFLSIGGGHQLKPLHYLPEKWAVAIGRRLGLIPPSVTSYENLFGSWGLYRTTIRDMEKSLRGAGFDILSVKPRYMRETPLNLAKMPLLGDFLTWHVEFYCQKGRGRAAIATLDPC